MPPIGPPLYFYTIEVDDLANQLVIPNFHGEKLFFNTTASVLPYRSIKVDTGKVSYKLSHGSINAGSSASLELVNSSADYQTSGTATVIVIVIGSSTTVTDFEIIEDSSADSGAGTQKEDFPSVSLGSNQAITSQVLSFAASKYITVKANTGNIGNVIAWVIE